jgi:hypothetical protein
MHPRAQGFVSIANEGQAELNSTSHSIKISGNGEYRNHKDLTFTLMQRVKPLILAPALVMLQGKWSTQDLESSSTIPTRVHQTSAPESCHKYIK